MILHRLSGTGMDDPFSCFKLEVPVIRSRFLPLVNLAFWKGRLTVKVGRLLLLELHCDFCNAKNPMV